MTREVIEELVSCRLAKSCEKCPVFKCFTHYKGWRKEAEAIKDSRIKEIQRLDKEGWTVCGICELMRIDERYVKLILKRTPEFMEKLKIARR